MSQSQAGPSQAGPTPVRRSARLGSAAGSVTGSRAQSVATTTATPSRGGPARRKGPLPKVKTRESHAYGASGRLGAAEALSVPVTGFAQAFAAQRNDAVTRDEEQDSEHDSEDESIDELAANGPRSRLQSVASSHLNERLDDASRSASPEAEVDGTTAASDVDTSKSFGVIHEAGMAAVREVRSNVLHQRHDLGNTQHSQRRPQAPQFGAGPALQQRPQFSVSRPVGANAPRLFHGSLAESRIKGYAPIFAEPEPKDDEPWRWQKPVMGIFFLIGAALVASFFMPTSWSMSSSVSSSTSLIGAIGSRITHIRNDLVEWIRYDDIPGFDFPITDGYGRQVSEAGYETVFQRATKLERRTEAIESSLKTLKQYLPPALAVNRDKKGEIEIPDEFWRALVSKLQAEGITGTSDAFDGEWRTFLDKNRQKVLDTMEDGIKKLEIVERDEFLRLMKDEYTKLSRHVDKKIAEAVSGMSKDMKVLIKDNINRAVMDQVRIESLAYANLVANAELSLRKVNYFSTGLGARIDPYQTSSTFIEKKPALASLYRRVLTHPGRRPPIAALQKWEEPGDCWCAAPDNNNNGLAQLSILLGHEMYPRQVTIEHLPKEASLDFTSAPKDIELWAELPNDPTHRVQSAAGCRPGPKGYYCLGNFAYNVHGNNHVQTFNLDIDSTVPVSKTLLRVTDNWGSDHTCIYRVRLHGEPVVAAE